MPYYVLIQLQQLLSQVNDDERSKPYFNASEVSSVQQQQQLDSLSNIQRTNNKHHIIVIIINKKNNKLLSRRFFLIVSFACGPCKCACIVQCRRLGRQIQHESICYRFIDDYSLRIACNKQRSLHIN